VIADGHGWEAWHELPAERRKLYEMIRETGAENLLVLSGDRHAAGLYLHEDAVGYPLYEATSSSLNLPLSAWDEPGEEPAAEAGPYRISGPMYREANYGVLDIDWNAGAVALEIHDREGGLVFGRMVRLSDLKQSGTE